MTDRHSGSAFVSTGRTRRRKLVPADRNRRLSPGIPEIASIVHATPATDLDLALAPSAAPSRWGPKILDTNPRKQSACLACVWRTPTLRGGQYSGVFCDSRGRDFGKWDRRDIHQLIRSFNPSWYGIRHRFAFHIWLRMPVVKGRFQVLKCWSMAPIAHGPWCQTNLTIQDQS